MDIDLLEQALLLDTSSELVVVVQSWFKWKQGKDLVTILNQLTVNSLVNNVTDFL